MNDTLCPKDINLTADQQQKFFNFIMGDDLDFYEEFTIHLSDEEQERFFDANPDFMSHFPIGRGRIYLLRNKIFRGILRKIKGVEGGKE